jgi:hypothetical protein
MSNHIEAYWVSPDGDIYLVEKTHIQAVAENPKRYGTTLEKIKSEFKKYDEVFPFQEHKARRSILTKIIKTGWIRMRLNLRSAAWTAETWEWNEREKIALQIWQNKIKESGKNGFVKNHYSIK